MEHPIYSIKHNGELIAGTIPLAGSKSISNRALIIRALCQGKAAISSLASSKDTQILHTLLEKGGDHYDVGPAGTSFRFLTAYLSLQSGSQVLTGSERMLKRPIGPLVDALNQLGADIDYLGEAGYPPLRINPWKNKTANTLKIDAGVSSQFISALLMIAPYLTNGLSLSLEGKIVSRPYIEMTLGLMKEFGVDHEWNGQIININPGAYQFHPFQVEADWSAASYYYAIVAQQENASLNLLGLKKESWQGDAALMEIYKNFGVTTKAIDGGIHIAKSGNATPMLELNFIKFPDLAQTVMASCGALGINGLFSGLETLKIKETDRIQAMKTELEKVMVFLSKMPDRFSKKSAVEYYMVEGKAVLNNPVFQTYEDHRMAMALTTLAMKGMVNVESPEVVQKSYPEFWDHLQEIGFEINEVAVGI